MKKLFLIAFISLSLFACNNKTANTTAKIVQRKLNADSTLKITYTFMAKDKVFTDSVDVKNKNISSDSVTVEYQVSNPSENKLMFK